MSEENTWIDFSNASPWEESISQLEDILMKFEIGFRLCESDTQISFVSDSFTYDGLLYSVRYYFSSFSNKLNDEYLHWPVYMNEMMSIQSVFQCEENPIYSTFGISEYILFQLESRELRRYIDVNRSKQLLSSAILAMRHLECSIPIFVEGPMNVYPYLGSYLPITNKQGCQSLFSTKHYSGCPGECSSIDSFVCWFRDLTTSNKNSMKIRRSYGWNWYPTSTWRHTVYEKDYLRENQPVLFMLQGFSSVPMWGPSLNPLLSIHISIRTPISKINDMQSFDPKNAEYVKVRAEMTDLARLPLSSIWHSFSKCWEEARVEGERHILYNAGQRFYKQLINEEKNGNSSSQSMFSSMMDLLTGSHAVSTEAIVDAIKYIFTKRIQVNQSKLVSDVYRHRFVPEKYLESPLLSSTEQNEDNTPIMLPKRVILIPQQGKNQRYILPKASGSYHIDRCKESVADYDWVIHSSPVYSLVTLLSLRCGEIVCERPLETLSLFWYLFVSVIEFHFEQKKLLPHLGCIVDIYDNICMARPPLPTFQHNLLHQKLIMLNCCIEEKVNNSRYLTEEWKRTADDDSSDSEVSYLLDEEGEEEGEGEEGEEGEGKEGEEGEGEEGEGEEERFNDDVKKPEGKGILNWSGWYLTGTEIPCFLPITKDKDILTEDKVHQQQELLSQAGSSVNEIRDVFIDTVVDDIQAFKAANPSARFEDFIHWHSPRDWSPKEGSPIGVLSARMEGDNPLRSLYDSTQSVTASHQKRLFNAEIESELVLDYLRTLSPLSVMHQLMVPFLGATCFLLDHSDPDVVLLPIVNEILTIFKASVRELSLYLDRRNEMSQELIQKCAIALQKAEVCVTHGSALLHVTQGDMKLTDALLRNGFTVDVSDELVMSRESVIRLIQEKLDLSQSDSSIYEVWAQSMQSAEDHSLNQLMKSIGHKAVVEKRNEETVVSTVISSCDVFDM